MDIAPASLAQLAIARNGTMVLVEEDVGYIAQQLKELDPGLRVRFSEDAAIFIVYHLHPDTGKESLVLTAQELDGRVVARIRRLSSDDYNYVAELDALEEAKKADHEHEQTEKIGEIGERLHHALRVDRGETTSRIIVPRSA